MLCYCWAAQPSTLLLLYIIYCSYCWSPVRPACYPGETPSFLHPALRESSVVVMGHRPARLTVFDRSKVLVFLNCLFIFLLSLFYGYWMSQLFNFIKGFLLEAMRVWTVIPLLLKKLTLKWGLVANAFTKGDVKEGILFGLKEYIYFFLYSPSSFLWVLHRSFLVLYLNRSPTNTGFSFKVTNTFALQNVMLRKLF